MSLTALLQRMGLGRPEHRAWAMYDWANSAYATVIMAAVLPPFFATYYAAGLSRPAATQIYSTVTAVALLVAALLSPLLGILADQQRAKKKFLAVFTLLGCFAVALFFPLEQGAWKPAALLSVLAAVAFGLSLVLYEGLLPGIARKDELDRVSAGGYALGYVGGGLLLAVIAAGLLQPGRFGLADQATATRLGLLSVAVWWSVFSLPLFLGVAEPEARAPGAGNPLRAAGGQLLATLSRIRRHRDLFLFLAAFWFYNDGIGTIIKMAAIFGAEVGIAMHHLVLALLITQFVAFPFALLFGEIGSRWGPRNGLRLALGVYCLIAVLGYFIREAWHFYALAALVGTVQGGAQALSRSLFARMVPQDRAGEFFGFYSVSSKFATILGPILFAAVSRFTGDSRHAVLSIVVFFVGGLLLLNRVDVARGERLAQQPGA